jgi:hypothetical protein
MSANLARRNDDNPYAQPRMPVERRLERRQPFSLTDPAWALRSEAVLEYLKRNPATAKVVVRAFRGRMTSDLVVDALAWLKANGRASADGDGRTWRRT